MGNDIGLVVADMRPADKKAMLTRDGQGEYSSAAFGRLLDKGLVDRNFRFTELGWKVRQHLNGDRP